jgi:hypothetical protein
MDFLSPSKQNRGHCVQIGHVHFLSYHPLLSTSIFLSSSTLYSSVDFFWFIYGLFNDTVSSADYIASNDRIIKNNELKSTWKEAVSLVQGTISACTWRN